MSITDGVAVYTGLYADCVNLHLILAGQGVAVEIMLRADGGRLVPIDSGGDTIVFVSRADLERAVSIVEEFKQSGEKSWGWPLGSD